MSDKAFQDQGSVLHCHGCGADNEKGLQIKSHWDGDEAVCTWQPRPHYCGGSKSILNGGIIAALIDCHSLNLAIAQAYKIEGRPIGSQPRIHYVTGTLKISYIGPAPIDKTLHLRAKVIRVEGRKAWISCTLRADGRVCANGEVLGIRVQREEGEHSKSAI
jgi:acyl-coenzyme A thioesterase PaaI-like protein